ncbi:MAG: efflux RND transporter periplasmic adaptor subunit [Scytonematopsis contorta HA4267-MV1]|nr:efflux RND transporter periplasmic adaptor subunit [Scytonematopsis contorta HA4267-MV1]
MVLGLKVPFKLFVSPVLALVCVSAVGILTTSCASSSKESATAQPQTTNRGESRGLIPVDVATARLERLQSSPEYIGTTLPIRIVSLRSQVEGQLLALSVNVGDKLTRGQIVGQLDDAILRTAFNQAEAELATRKSEVARANTLISNARADVETARLELVQAQQDSQRQQKLLKEGAIALQLAEQSRTKSQTAAQALRAAQEQVRTEQQAVAAAQGRVVAQKALVEQAKQRRAFSRLISPITGVVTERVTETGNLLQPGGEVLKIADFSQVKVVVQVSELELGNIQPNQTVQVRFDAFPEQPITGRVARISPAADATARLIPVEVVVPNIGGKIGSGLLARVNFQNLARPRVVVPLTALETGTRERRSTRGQRVNQRGSQTGNPAANSQQDNSQQKNSQKENLQGKIFVVTEGAEKPTVKERTVTLGERADAKVEVLSGLQAGERYVVRSGRPLKNGAAVGFSILSEPK